MTLRRQDELLNVATLAADLTQCDSAVICTTGSGSLLMQVAIGVQVAEQPTLPPSSRYCEMVRVTQIPKLVADIAQDPAFQENPDLCFADRTLRFYAGVPVLNGDGKVIAVLAVLDHAPRPELFDPQSVGATLLIKRLEKLAVLATTILELASERDESRTELAESALLRDILGGLVRQSSLPGSLDAILRRVMDVTKAAYAQVWEIRDDAWMASQLAFTVRDENDEAAFAMLRSDVALPIEELAISELLVANAQIVCLELAPESCNLPRAMAAMARGISCLIVSSLLESPRRFAMVLGMRQTPRDLALQISQIERISQAVQPILSTKLASEQIQLLGSALAETQDGVVLFKASYPQGTYRITYTNRAFSLMTQHAALEIIGASPFVLPSLDAEPVEVERLRNLLELQQSGTSKLQIRRRDGSQFWAEVTLVPLPNVDGLGHYFVAVLHDVTQDRADAAAQVQRERELRAVADALQLRTEQLSRAQKIAKMGIWRWQSDQPTVNWSDSVYEIFGQSPENFVPTAEAILELVHPDDRYLMRRRYRSWSSEGASSALEFRVMLPDRQIRHLVDDTSVEIGPSGAVVAVTGYVQDITERKEGEALLLHAEKLRSIGQLTGSIAHDFNNLLTVISVNLEMISLLVGVGHPAEDMLKMAARATRNGADLTSNLLAFARRQPLHPVPVDLSDLLRSFRMLATPSLGERHQVTYSVESDLPRCLVDPSGLENALLNLLVNSRDAMPDGGVIALQAERVPPIVGSGRRAGRSSGVRQATLRPGDYVSIAVQDTGVGIPGDLLDTVFEPFFTTKASGKGTGLGLSSVVGFARQSGGDVDLISQPGVGTTLRLYLPAVISDPV